MVIPLPADTKHKQTNTQSSRFLPKFIAFPFISLVDTQQKLGLKSLQLLAIKLVLNLLLVGAHFEAETKTMQQQQQQRRVRLCVQCARFTSQPTPRITLSTNHNRHTHKFAQLLCLLLIRRLFLSLLLAHHERCRSI